MAARIDLKQTVEVILAGHGPLSYDDIAQQLADAGMAPADIPDARCLEMACPVVQLLDERFVWLPTLLAGRVFAHRVDSDEIAHEMLALTPDLDPFTALCDYAAYQCLADGSAVEIAMAGYNDDVLEQRGIPAAAVPDGGVLLLEPGTLAAAGARPGDLVGLRLTAAGVALESIPEPTGDGAAVGTLLAAAVDADPPGDFATAVWEICAADPALFTDPLPPLNEIADDAGLVRVHSLLAPAGFDFENWRLQARSAQLAEQHGLPPEAAEALAALIMLHERLAQWMRTAGVGASMQDLLDAAGEDPLAPVTIHGITGTKADALSWIGSVLAYPRPAQLLVHETLTTDPAEVAAVFLLAQTLETLVPREARAAARWMQAIALERSGDIEAAERELLAAESLDVDSPLPLLDLARFASDRGDAERGLALLRRAGVSADEPLVSLLERFRAAPRADVGRNEPCWCGSGRKYKKCHLDRETLTVEERAGWLYAKAAQHLAYSGEIDGLRLLAYERARYADPDDEDALTDALTDPLVTDAALFEGGMFADFLKVRGALLPDDERALAEQWLLVRRSVFEVEQVQPGQGATVRDLRTGDVWQMWDPPASRRLKPKEMFCGHALPVGDTVRFAAGIEPVELHERDPLIKLLDSEPGAAELVAQLSLRFAPPALVDIEGDPIVFCVTTVRVSDPGAITAAFDQRYDRIDGEVPAQWYEHTTINGTQHLRAVLSLDADLLRVDSGSEERSDRILAVVAELDPDLEVLGDTRASYRDAWEATKDGPPPLPEDPETVANLAQYFRDYEDTWLDTTRPVLGGLTPRQAAEDPTRREDLIKLLDSYRIPTRPDDFDTVRLRAILGLE